MDAQIEKVIAETLQFNDRPFYWVRTGESDMDAPSGWYVWRTSGLVYLGEELRSLADSAREGGKHE